MRIPLTTVSPRFYVATSEKHAFSSWDSLNDALACIERFDGDPNGGKIRGVVETGPQGRAWAQEFDMSNKANKNPVSDRRWRGRSFKKHGDRIADARDEDRQVIDDNEARYREKVERERAADYDHNHRED